MTTEIDKLASTVRRTIIGTVWLRLCLSALWVVLYVGFMIWLLHP